MENHAGKGQQQAARREVDAFLRTCEAYLRETVEAEWIAEKGADFFAYLWERLKEASRFGLEDKTLIMKYMTAAVLTDDTDPAERAHLSRLKRDLEGGAYDAAELLNLYIEHYLEETGADAEDADQYPGQCAATEEILDQLAIALRASIRAPFLHARLDVERFPGYVNFSGHYRDRSGNEQAIDDLLVDDTAFDAVHRLYAIMAASGADDWNRLQITSSPDAVREAMFWSERDEDQL